MKILVLHGVNLNMFGRRDPAQYGTATLAEIDSQLHALAGELGVEIECMQSNDEGAFIGRIHRVLDEDIAAVVINAGAWTHTSLALADALAIVTVPVVEVHMSNVHKREAIRRTSLIAPVCAGSIAGFGVTSYLLGLRAAVALAREQRPDTVLV